MRRLSTWSANLRAFTDAWVHRHAHSARARMWLFWLAFVESSVSPMPPDILLVAILLAGAERWAAYAAITTVGSVLGGLFGYLIGAAFFSLFGEALVRAYGLEAAMRAVGEQFAANAFLAIFVAAFTPIPYKVFTIAAGLFSVPFGVFAVASVIGRGARFFAVAYIVRVFGAAATRLALRYFNAATALAALAAVALLIAHLLR
jgi:membrane protein YqaA with SNARE-associated domain